MLKKIALVFLGGAIGAAVREFLVLGGSTFHGHFPSAILVANLTAAFLIGLVTALTVKKDLIDQDIQLFVVTGMMGGLSTFSTLIWGTVMLVREPGQAWIGWSYLAISLAAGLALVELGLRFGTSLRRARLE